MTPTLEGVALKIERAYEHFVSLVGEPVRSVYTDVYALTAKPDPDGLGYRFYIGELKELDSDRWAVVLGDFFFNLRSALDQLVYQLHVVQFSGMVPDDAERDSAFPIKSAKPVTKNGVFVPTTKWNQIRRLGNERALIERLQPYNARDDADASIREIGWRLASLDRLNNIDKHRRLHVVRSAIDGAAHPIFSPEVGFGTDAHFGPVESNTQVDHWRYLSRPPRLAEEISAHCAFVDISLDEPGEQDSVIMKMQALYNGVVDVVELLATPFPAIRLPERL